MDHQTYSDAWLRGILQSVQTIALTGASPNPQRPSFAVMGFLLSRGYRVIPVNPGQAGKTIHGQPVMASLADIAEPIDMIDVFRASEYVDAVVDEALSLPVRPKVIWTQLGVYDERAAAKAEAAGMAVVMNRCPAIEYPRLIGGEAHR
ncbi:CoA-binding protein [Allorhizobium undicola]|uniref:CoA-binding protein n=1 Tax=Allorhizobium undicola TaxID=78527 RepID=UPI000487F53C|nr:CoA-binding protein [Allorhizobium undicola]